MAMIRKKKEGIKSTARIKDCHNNWRKIRENGVLI